MADIKLKDRTGAEHTYTGKRQLRVPSTDGNLVIFTQGNGEKEEEEKTVELDFSGAATQEVTPTDGKVLSKVTVKKPDTLAPENIKKDVAIGGVTGTLEASTANLQTSKLITITENGTMDVAPDEGFDGMQSVNVDVDVPDRYEDGRQDGYTEGYHAGVNDEQASHVVQSDKNEIIGKNGMWEIEPDSGYTSMSKVSVQVDVPSDSSGGAVFLAFEKDPNGNYIAGYFNGIETSDQVSNLFMSQRCAIWICIDFDVKENGTNILKGATLNWNFEKFKNLILSGSHMYFSGEIVDEIQLDLIDGKWTLAKSTVDDILVKIKAAFVQLNGSEDAEIVLNDILQCITAQ